MSVSAKTFNQSATDWDILHSLISEEGKNGKAGASIFQLFISGSECKCSNRVDNLSGTFLVINSKNDSQDFFCLSTNRICDVLFTANIQCIPLYYHINGKIRQENVTDWALKLFNT